MYLRRRRWSYLRALATVPNVRWKVRQKLLSCGKRRKQGGFIIIVVILSGCARTNWSFDSFRVMVGDGRWVFWSRAGYLRALGAPRNVSVV